MTYDVLGFHGKIDDQNVHTTLFKPSNRAIAQMLKKGKMQRQFTVVVKLKCTPQPEHLAEALYLHHKANIKHINAITLIGEASPKPSKELIEGRYEEYRLIAIKYTTDQAFDTSFTINYPKQRDTPNTPFVIIAGDKDTLTGAGMNARTVHGIPDFVATKPAHLQA